MGTQQEFSAQAEGTVITPDELEDE